MINFFCIIYFNPSIGISEIIGIDELVDNKDRKSIKLLLGSLKYSDSKEGQSIYFLDYFKNDNSINLIKSFRINRRIREIIKTDKEILFYFETTSEIGVMNFAK